MMKIAVNCGVNHRGGSCDVESSVAVLQIAKGKSQKGTFYFSHCFGLPLVRNKASRRSITTGKCHRMECLDHGCEARLWASNMISLLQLKTQALIFTMPSEISWLLALQRCDWCSFCIHLSAGAAALAVGKEDVYSRRRSDGCTVRPSLRRRDSFRRSERLSMGDAFCIGDLRFFERKECFRRIAKRDILLSFECWCCCFGGWEKNMYIPVDGATGVRYARRSADGILLATASD
jgi:hypothetical protein